MLYSIYWHVNLKKCMGNHISAYFQEITTKKLVLIFFAIGVAIYSNSLFNKFVGDDFVQIRDNPSVHSITKIPSLFF